MHQYGTNAVMIKQQQKTCLNMWLVICIVIIITATCTVTAPLVLHVPCKKSPPCRYYIIATMSVCRIPQQGCVAAILLSTHRSHHGQVLFIKFAFLYIQLQSHLHGTSITRFNFFGKYHYKTKSLSDMCSCYHYSHSDCSANTAMQKYSTALSRYTLW